MKGNINKEIYIEFKRQRELADQLMDTVQKLQKYGRFLVIINVFRFIFHDKITQILENLKKIDKNRKNTMARTKSELMSKRNPFFFYQNNKPFDRSEIRIQH